MAIYTVGRRRVIIGLLLSAVLLLTLDLRGNPVIDTVRDGFSRAMSPVERAADVVTHPVQRGWNSYNDYDDLVSENQALRDQLDRQRGTQAAAEASIIDYNLLLALDNLPSLTGIPTAKAQVVGGATNNIDQTVEINKGTNDGIRQGMAVVNQAGLIGKITNANATTSTVMLVTDPRYSVAVEILAGTGETSLLDDLETSNTTPSGNTDEENDQIVQDAEDPAAGEDAEADAADVGEDGTGDDGGDETLEGDENETGDGDVPGVTNPEDPFAGEPDLPQAGDELPENGDELPENGEDLPETGEDLPETGVVTDEGSEIPSPPESGPGDDAPPITDPDGEPIETTTTTVVDLEPEQLEKEFGELQGRGAGLPTQIRFLQDIPSLAVLEVGDLVETAGPSESLAPPNIPVGRVINRANRAGVAGPLLEIELYADLDKLNFVRVVLFRPLSEAGE